MNKYIALLLSSTVLLSAGCSTRLGQFTAASTHNVRNLDYSIEDKSKQVVYGDTCIHSVFFIPIGHFSDRLQRAVDDAIENGHEKGLDGDLLVNVRIDHSAWTSIIYGQNCIKVKGDLVQLK